ncbi:lyase family protein [Novosphingobium sp.]|uniref:lyase family protein n=1 Tax=Novosphingobium sp. TaxID=1874826 RepID=UPI00262881F7|nr:lyase family protein [Novosphingobium sp.]
MALRSDGRTRSEHDSFGPIKVPAAAYWGAQTQRSLVHFDFPEPERMPVAIVHALATIKVAASRINRAHGLPADLADGIETAAQEVMRGDLDDHFPLTVWQTGSGTHTNMNVNEVIAGRANEILTCGHAWRLAAIVGFTRHALQGLRADEARIADLVERSLMLVTALAPHIGYDKAARIAHDAHARGLTLREAALESGIVDADVFDRLVRPQHMVTPQS